MQQKYKYVLDFYFILASAPNEIMVTIDIFSIPHLDEKLEVSLRKNVQILAVIKLLNLLKLVIIFYHDFIEGNNDRSQSYSHLGRHTTFDITFAESR